MSTPQVLEAIVETIIVERVNGEDGDVVHASRENAVDYGRNVVDVVVGLKAKNDR